MSTKFIINELNRNKKVFRDLFKNSLEPDHLWKPTADKWCLLEIDCHLYDEEREDFRTRVKHCLEDPARSFTPIDPANWVTSRKYTEQNYPDKVRDFLDERDGSITWLRSLIDPNWDSFHEHPKLGKMSAGLFLHNWLAHDYIHIRQILKLRYTFLSE
jgi:hypothetical protein